MRIRDVLGDPEQVARLPLFVQDRDLLGVKYPGPLGLGLDGLLRDVEHRPPLQHFPVPGGEEVGFVLGKEVVVVPADQILPGIAEELLAGSVEPYEPQILRRLDEDHVGNVLDNGVQEGLRPMDLLLRSLALGDVESHEHPSHDLSRERLYRHDPNEVLAPSRGNLRDGALAPKRRAVVGLDGPRYFLWKGLPDGPAFVVLLR